MTANDDESQPGFPSVVRWRILFEIAPGDRRGVFWFEMRSDDLYWGPIGRGRDHPPMPFSGDSTTITVPNDVEGLPVADVKASWHASGRAHVKVSTRPGERTGAMWGDKATLDAPLPIAAVLTKAPIRCAPYRKKPDKGGASALILRVPPDQQETRRYFEFFLAPVGAHAAPPAVLAGVDWGEVQPHLMPLREELTLAMRQSPLAGEMGAWRTDTQIWLHLEPDDVRRRRLGWWRRRVEDLRHLVAAVRNRR